MCKFHQIIFDYYWKRFLKKYNCKYTNGLDSIKENNIIFMEENVRIGAIKIESKKLDVSIGAHTYIRSGCELHEVAKIGRYCSISNNVIIGLDKHAHPINWLSTHPFNNY